MDRTPDTTAPTAATAAGPTTTGPTTTRSPAAARRHPSRDRGTVVLGGLLALTVLALLPPILSNGFPGLFLQRLFDSLSNGVAYAMTAVGLVLIFKATGIINFVQANLAMFGAYLCWQFVVGWNVPIVVGIAVGCVVMAAAGAGIERTLIRPFDPTEPLPIVLVTFGLAAIFEAFAGGLWGLEFHAFPSPFPAGPEDFVSVAGARFRYETIGSLVLLALVVGGLHLLLNRTKLGLRFRAVSSSVESARLAGIRVGPTLQFGWALAAAFGTLGAALVARQTNLEPAFMAKLVIFAFAAATLGGLDSIGGAVVGSFVVAAVQSLVLGYGQELPGLSWMKSNFSLVVAFVLILIVLLFKPAGLFGTRTTERV
jgi:branched-chain amino acid transport system permease protein